MTESAPNPTPAFGRSLRLSVADGVLHALMLGACESYLGALAIDLGHEDDNLALLATVPLLCGAAAQLAAAPLTALAGGRKRFVVLGAACQALAILGLCLIAVLQVGELLPFLALKTLFWSAGATIVPAWGAWMADLTADVDRERYFGRRSGLVQLGLMLAFTGTGAILHAAVDDRRLAFGAVFLAAAVARGASVWVLLKKAEPPAPPESRPARVVLRQALSDGQWRVPSYLAFLMFGAHLSVPFFTPYMLRADAGLALDYATYTGLLAVAIASKAVFFPLCGALATRVGLRGLLIFGGVGLATIPVVWAFSTDLRVLLAAQLLSGVVWASLEFAGFQLLLQGSPEGCRSEYLSLAGFLAAVGQLCGALLGGWVLTHSETSYTEVFLASSALRGAALVVLLERAWSIRLSGVHWLTALAAVRPTVGGVRRILPLGRTRVWGGDPSSEVGADEL